MDASRQAGGHSRSYGLASNLHYEQGLGAQDILGMDDRKWMALAKDETIDRQEVVNVMRAYEHYQ
jgi:hypothetical protein